MRIVVIGATGHVGGYLIPRLVTARHDVIAISRGQQAPYRQDPAWHSVRRITADRQAEDEAGSFAGRIADLQADIVIDMICFTRGSADQLVDALAGSVGLLVHCGSIWVHGPSAEVPTREDTPRRAFGEYGLGKVAIEEVLIEASNTGRLPTIVLHPGHISGPGWAPINPAGNLDLDVWRRLASGQRIALPNFGLETLHHVHADDVAQAFELAIRRPTGSVGQSYHVVSEQAITLRGYAEAVASWFGLDADIGYLPYAEFRETTSAEHADVTLEHISRSSSVSIDKARRQLGYLPRYSSLQSVAEAIQWLQQAGQIDLGPNRLVVPSI